MSFTDEELLELAPGIGQRVDRFVFNLLNTDRTPFGSIDVTKNTVPQIQLDTHRKSFRTVQSLVVSDPPLLPNLQSLRLQPVMVLENGSAHRCGVLMFGEDDRNPISPRSPWLPQLYDESFLLDQKLDQSWSVPQGSSVLAAFTAMAAEILDPLGIPHVYDVDDVGTDSDLLFPVGSSRLDALNAMAKLLAVLGPFFDHDGIHRLKVPPTVDVPAEFTYGAGGRIVKNSVTTKSTLFSAPNRYLVIGDNIGGAPIAGYYDLPPSAPHSAAQNGGNVITDSQTVPGVTDPELAAQIAYVNALTDRTTYGTASFDGAGADPRHDVYNTVNLLGITYLETGHSITCAPGGSHHHDLARMWG